MMEAVRDMTGHWSRPTVHFESFVEGTERRTAEDRAFSVRLARSGEVVEVPAHMSILEALRARGHQVPSSCESGTCGTCRTRLLGGEVHGQRRRRVGSRAGELLAPPEDAPHQRERDHHGEEDAEEEPGPGREARGHSP